MAGLNLLCTSGAANRSLEYCTTDCQSMYPTTWTCRYDTAESPQQ